MSWAGRDHRAYLTFAPAALAGMLAPYAALPVPNPRACCAREGVAGMALGAAAAAAALAAAGYLSAFVFAVWAAAALLSLLAPAKVRPRAASFMPTPWLSGACASGLWVNTSLLAPDRRAVAEGCTVTRAWMRSPAAGSRHPDRPPGGRPPGACLL